MLICIFIAHLKLKVNKRLNQQYMKQLRIKRINLIRSFLTDSFLQKKSHYRHSRTVLVDEPIFYVFSIRSSSLQQLLKLIDYIRLVINIQQSMDSNRFWTASSSKNMTFKRDKDQFHASTTAFSNAFSANTNKYIKTKNQNLQQDQQFNKRDGTVEKQQRWKQYNPWNTHSSASRNKDAYERLSQLIKRSKQVVVDGLINKPSHKYVPRSVVSQDYLCKYHKQNQKSFPPKFILERYQEKRKKRNQNIHYQYGILQKSGYFYFIIENELYLINALQYVDSYQRQRHNYEFIELTQPAVSVQQIIISDLSVQDIERHPFGQKSIILAVWQQWELHFYSFQPLDLKKLKSMEMKIKLSAEAVFIYDYCKEGNLYYMSELGQIGKISLFNKRINFLTFSKGFSIHEYLYKFHQYSNRKAQKMINQSLFNKLKQFYKDFIYYWSEKQCKGLALVCDRKNQLLYTLTQTFLKKKINLNRTQNESNREIRIYNIAEQKNSKLSKLSDSSPHLIARISEEALFNEIGVYLFKDIGFTKFQISGLYLDPNYKTENRFCKCPIIVVLLSNGSRIYFALMNDSFVFVQLINLPNIDEVVKAELNRQTQALSEKEQSTFKTIKYKFNEKQRSLAITGLHRKNLIFLLLTESIGETNQEFEQVCVLSEGYSDSISQPNENRIFIDHSAFKIFLGPQLHSNIYKKQLKDKLTEKCAGFEKVEDRQVMYYPRQFMFLYQKTIIGLTKLRPVDNLINLLERAVENNIKKNALFSDYELQKLLSSAFKITKAVDSVKENALETIAMLIQIYCDVQGVYFFPQKILSRASSKSKANERDTRINQNHDKKRIYWQNNGIEEISKLKICKYTDLDNSNLVRNQDDFKLSILKLIERLLVQILKIEKIKVRQNLQTEYPCPRFSIIQEAALLYLSRFLKCIWDKNTEQVLRVLPYLNSVLKKILELSAKFQIFSNADGTKEQYFPKIHSFCSKIIQYNQVLNVLNAKIGLIYSKGLEQNRETKQLIQEKLLQTIRSKNYKHQVLNEWKKLFPSFSSLELLKVVKLQSELAAIQKQSERKDIIKSNYKDFPPYFLSQCYKDGNISKKQYEQLSSTLKKSDKQTGNNHILMTKDLGAWEKVEYSIQQIQKQSTNLKQKQFLLSYANTNLSKVNNFQRSKKEIQEKRLKLQKLENTIKIQDQILKQLSQHQLQIQGQTVSEEVKKMINQVLLNKEQLLKLVLALDSNYIKIIHYCLFWDEKIKIRQCLENFVRLSPNKYRKAQQIRNDLLSLFKLLSIKNMKRITLADIITILDSVCFEEIKQKEDKDFTIFINMKNNKKNQLPDIFWVPAFLRSFGWNEHFILEHYIESIIKMDLNQEDLKIQSKNLYDWISAFVFVKESFVQGKKIFILANDRICSSARNTRSAALLTNFIKDNKLVY